MSAVDLTLLCVLLVSAGLSFLRGFVREVLSLIAWVLSVWVAVNFTPAFSVVLEPHIAVPAFRVGAAFLGLFLLCLIVAAMVNRLAGQLVKHTGFSSTDRMLGVLFGAARGGVIIAVFVLLAGVTEWPQSTWWHESLLLGQFEQLAFWMKDSLPPDIAGQFAYQQ